MWWFCFTHHGTTESPLPGIGYLYWTCWLLVPYRHSKLTNYWNDVTYLPEIDSKTLFPKTPHILIRGYGAIMLVLTMKSHSYFLGFITLGGFYQRIKAIIVIIELWALKSITITSQTKYVCWWISGTKLWG